MLKYRMQTHTHTPLFCHLLRYPDSHRSLSDQNRNREAIPTTRSKYLLGRQGWDVS